MNNNVRELHTGFYSDRAELIIRRLLDSEQSYQSSLKKTFKVKSFRYLEVKRAPDNEVVFTCGKLGGWDYRNSFDRISDADALNHIAWCFKQCVLRRLKSILLDEDKAEKNWNRSNTLNFRTDSINTDDISVSEAYFIYDRLRQRKNAANRYSKELSESLIGLPLDPIMTEMKSGMLEEIERIKKECSDAKAKLHLEKEKAILKYREEMEARLVEARNALNNEAAAKIAKIENELAALMART